MKVKTTITMIRYFFNLKGNKEYLVSADINKKMVIWDISNDYKILNIVNAKYTDANIYSCYLFFDNSKIIFYSFHAD